MPYTPLANKTTTSTNFTMKNKTITKIVLAALGLSGLAFIALTKIQTDYLPLLGKIVSFAAAVAILAMAATDNTRVKRLN